MTLTDVMQQNREENLLIVCTMPYLLDKVNATVLRALGAEVLRPAKQDQLQHQLWYGGSSPGHNMYTMLFIHPGLEHQLWYGRSSPQS